MVDICVVAPGTFVAPLPWAMPPSTGVDASVVTPAGSSPLATRLSHSQPTRPVPSVVVAPGTWSPSVVCRQTRLRPSAPETFRPHAESALSPAYIWPTSAFSGRLGPAGSRHVAVGPSGSGSPPWVVLYSTSVRRSVP